MPEEETKVDRSSPGRRPPNAILRYSGMAMQMMVIIVAGALGGMWLDGRYPTYAPLFTGGLTVLSVVIAMYTAVKDLLRDGGSSSRKLK